MHFRAITLCLTLQLAQAAAQDTSRQSSRPYVIQAAHMIDGRSDVVQNDIGVIVQGERIVAVGPRAQIAARIPAGAQIIDLGGATILPGLIDNHIHVLPQADITAADWPESSPTSSRSRAIR